MAKKLYYKIKDVKGGIEILSDLKTNKKFFKSADKKYPFSISWIWDTPGDIEEFHKQKGIKK